MQIDVLGAISKGVLIGLFMAISVGPTLFAVVKYSMSNSHKAGIAFVIGVSFSDIMYVIIANVAASWLEVLNTYSRYIAYGGSSLLIIVGLATLLKKNAPTSDKKTIPTITGAHYFRIWLSGFLINSINPGVIISWLAAVTATVNQSGAYRFILFGTCLSLILVIDFLKVFLADKIKGLLTPARVIKVQRITGFILLILGTFLLLKTILE